MVLEIQVVPGSVVQTGGGAPRLRNFQHNFVNKPFPMKKYCRNCDEMLTLGGEKCVTCKSFFHKNGRCGAGHAPIGLCPVALEAVIHSKPEIGTVLVQQNLIIPRQFIPYPSIRHAVPFHEQRHRFEMHTYTHPTRCAVCEHMLKGLAHQGLQCKDCKYNVHVDCADRVLHYCTRRV